MFDVLLPPSHSIRPEPRPWHPGASTQSRLGHTRVRSLPRPYPPLCSDLRLNRCLSTHLGTLQRTTNRNDLTVSPTARTQSWLDLLNVGRGRFEAMQLLH